MSTRPANTTHSESAFVTGLLRAKDLSASAHLIANHTLELANAGAAVLYTIEDGQPLTILATFAVYGAGLLNLIARGVLENPGGTILAQTYEYGCAYLLTAGLMNLLLVLDAYDIAAGKKR